MQNAHWIALALTHLEYHTAVDRLVLTGACAAHGHPIDQLIVIWKGSPSSGFPEQQSSSRNHIQGQALSFYVGLVEAETVI